MRRLTWLCVVVALAGLGPSVAADAPALEVVLLGTGSPAPRIDRFGPATLVRAGSEVLLFDAGRGASQRLWQLRVPLGELTCVFLTHLHSDHVVGLPDVWLTGFLPAPFGRRAKPLQVRGPAGTSAMMTALRTAFEWDLRVRTDGAEQGESGVAVDAQDIAQGVVLQRNGVKVTAFTVDHGEHLRPALGYRVDYRGRSVVLSGDTRPSDNLVQVAKGADVVVHEVFAAPTELIAASDIARTIAGYHSSPEQAGKVFERIRPRLAVFTHVALFTNDAARPALGVEDITARARATYAGPLVVGEDLMTIAIGDEVAVRRR